MSVMDRLRRRLERAERQVDGPGLLSAAEVRQYLKRYANDPEGYFRDVLKVELWEPMARIARACVTPPCKISVEAGHGVGKTHLSGGLANWFYDTHEPSAVVTTAPKEKQIKLGVWREVRVQRRRARVTIGGVEYPLPMDFIGPAAPEMKEHEDHYALGHTAEKGEAFQGQHLRYMMFIFDEAVGLDMMYFITTSSMFKPELGHVWLCFCNPTDTSSALYQVVHGPGSDWLSVPLSCLNHPNVVKQLRGGEPDIPQAVTLSQVGAWVRDWCEPVRDEDPQATDIEWPPGSGQWHRPGPEFDARCRGLWPTGGSQAVWSDALWAACTAPPDGPLEVDVMVMPEIGCDVAGPGKDLTEIHVRWGPSSIHHERHHGWQTPQIEGRLIEVARDMADRVNVARRLHGGNLPEVDPFAVPMKIDDGNMGRGVCDHLEQAGYMVVRVLSGSTAAAEMRYPNKRSELWFQTVAKARAGLVRLGRLDGETLAVLQMQAKAPTWRLMPEGRRQVEPKEKTMERLGRSPDSMDALNLAYYEMAWEAPTVLDVMPPTLEERYEAGRGRRGGQDGRRRYLGR